MTVVVCLNFGDKAYLVSDSLVTTRSSTGNLTVVGYCLKIYTLKNRNVLFGFSGSLASARAALSEIGRFASSSTLQEDELCDHLPQILEKVQRNWDKDADYDLEIVYVGIVPGSKAYEREKFPGLGIPPKSVCGVVSARRGSGEVKVTQGKAIHVPSTVKVESPDRRIMMDAFVIGSGSQQIEKPEYFWGMRYQTFEFVSQVLPLELQSFFEETPIEESGVGGAYIVGLLSEGGVSFEVNDPRDPPHGRIYQRNGAIFVSDKKTQKSEIIKTLWDQRLPYEIEEEDEETGALYL
ncbi:MAG: hypothetical protein H6661_04070 [Ardenticatenaceae bacterium]|nr:hypothetical protein [Ardenticatenaceae bacterium]